MIERVRAAQQPEPAAGERRALVVIPAFNEADRLPPVLATIRAQAPGLDVLVIDDGSSDRTAEVARSLGALVCTHPFNMGYGAALQTGYKFALRQGYRRVVQVDGDGQHDPSYIPALLAAAADADLVLGSRFAGAGDYRPPFVRGVGMWIFSRLASAIIGQRVTDVTSGFRVLGELALVYCASSRFPVDYPDADLLIALHRAGVRIAEVPVVMRARKGGVSMHAGLKPLFYVCKMALSIVLTLVRHERVR